jgi:hypothetical protein
MACYWAARSDLAIAGSETGGASGLRSVSHVCGGSLAGKDASLISSTVGRRSPADVTGTACRV